MVIANLSERFGINLRFYATSAFWLSTSYGLATIRNLLTSYVGALLLSIEMFGQYKFVLLIFNVINAFMMNSLPTAIAQSVAKDDPQKVPLYFTLRIFTYVSIFGMIILLGSTPFLMIWERDELLPSIFLTAALFIPFQLSTTFFNGLLIGRAAFKEGVKADALTTLLTLIGLVGFVAIGLQIPTLIVLYFLPTIISRFAYVRRWMREYPSFAREWHIFKYGLSLSIHNTVQILVIYFDGIIVSAMFGLNELAVFSVALFVPEFFRAWGKSLMNVVFPRFAAAQDSWLLRRKLIFLASVCSVAALALVGVYGIFASDLMQLLFPQYPSSQLAHLSRLAMLTLCATPWTVFIQYLLAQKWLPWLRASQWLSAIALAFSLLILVPHFHLTGVIIARLIFWITYTGTATAAVLFKPVTTFPLQNSSSPAVPLTEE
jgi:O-antigen/teichoic acid export membrane protein